MRRVRRGVWCNLLAVGTLMAALSCGDRAPLTAPGDPRAASMAGGNGSRVKVKILQLESNKLAIGGPATTYSVSLGNSGLAIPTGVSLRGEIVQGATTHSAGTSAVDCEPGAPDKLPTGTCSTGGTAVASNSDGESGNLIAGSATFVLHVVQSDGTTETDLASKSVAVTLVANPAITELALDSTTLAIDGPGTGYTVTINNPTGGSVPGVGLQGYIVQGTTIRAAGDIAASCPSLNGILPVGSCTMTFSAGASNSGAGTGTLVPGAATFRLDLIQTIGTDATLDSRSIPITLVSTATIGEVSPIDSLVIGGAGVDYTATIENPTASSAPGLRLQAWVSQGGGSARRAAGGSVVSCGAGLGTLPGGSCQMSMTALTSNEGLGSGTLVPGQAEFELELIQRIADTDYRLDVKTFTIDLQAITITDLTPSSTELTIDAPSSTPFEATVENPGGSLSAVTVETYVRQNGHVVPAGRAPVACSGQASGQLPSGTCAASGETRVSSSADGGDALVPGAAELEVRLTRLLGQVTIMLASEMVDVTLAAGPPRIVSLVLETDTLEIGGPSVTATIEVQNPGPELTDVDVQGLLLQGTLEKGTGGFSLRCGAEPGVLPHTGTETCTAQFSVGASNVAGFGTLVPGEATLRVVIEDVAEEFDSEEQTVTLIDPCATPLPTPQVVIDTIVDHGTFWRYELSVSNYSAYADRLFAPAPDLDPCGGTTAASRTWVDIYRTDTGANLYGFCTLGHASDLNDIWVDIPKDDLPPKFEVRLWDRRCNRTVTSNQLDTGVIL